MAMTGAGLSAALKSALEGEYDIISEAQLQKFCDAAGNAIVSYIQANAQVDPGTFVSPSGTGGGPITGLGGPLL